MNSIKRILGYLGFRFCTDCGSKLTITGTEYHPVFEIIYLECPHCDHLDRFDLKEWENEHLKS